MNDLVERDAPASQIIPAGEAGIAGAMVRARAEIESAIVVAKKFPRDEVAAEVKLMRAVDRPGLAEEAIYSFPRAGVPVEGPSVNLAREAARCWGNIRYGLRIVTVDDDRVHILGYAVDCETGTYVEAEDKFSSLIFRKKGGWVKPDERDLRELVNRRGAFCVRNAILQIIPRDIIEKAVEAAKETIRKAAAGELKQNPEDAIRRMVLAFARIGVTSEMIAAKLGHETKLIDARELADLRTVFRSITDGNSTRGEHFEIPGAGGARETGTADILQGAAPATPGPGHHEAPKPVPAPVKPPATPPAAAAASTPAPANDALAAFRSTFCETLVSAGRTPDQAAAIWGELAAAHADPDQLALHANAYLDSAEEPAKSAPPPTKAPTPPPAPAPTNGGAKPNSLFEATARRKANLEAAKAAQRAKEAAPAATGNTGP